jgi:hypothetical protein
MISFETEEQRMSHPQAQNIPMRLWRDYFNKQLTDFQLTLMQLPTQQLEKFVQLHQKDIIGSGKEITTLIAIFSSRTKFAPISNQLLETLTKLCNFNLSDTFRLGGLYGETSFMEYLIHKYYKSPANDNLLIEALSSALCNNCLRVVQLLVKMERVQPFLILGSQWSWALESAATYNCQEVLDFISDHYTLSLPAQRRKKTCITILTDAPHKTFGDVSAAAKFIQALSTKIPSEDINWIICESDKSLGVSDLVPSQVNVKIISSWKELFSDDLLKWLVSSKKTIAFPTYKYLDKISINLILSFGELLDISEYDLKTPDNGKVAGITSYMSGLGKNALGIFYTEKPQEAELPRGFLPPVIRRMLNKEHSRDVLNNRVFFGYTNREETECTNFVTPNLFILTCMALIKTDDIAIIARFSTDNAQKDLEELSQIEPNTLFEVHYQGKIDYYPSHNHKEHDRRVILCNPFPINHHEMSILLNYSNPFCQVTGDQSMSEALSYGKLPLYQCMEWKSAFFDQVMLRASTVGTELWEFFMTHYHVTEPLVTAKMLVNMMLNKHPILLKQASMFSELIRKRHNLSDALVRVCELANEPVNCKLGKRRSFFNAKPNPSDAEDEKEITPPHKNAKLT